MHLAHEVHAVPRNDVGQKRILFLTFCVGGCVGNLLERVQERAQDDDRVPAMKSEYVIIID